MQGMTTQIRLVVWRENHGIFHNITYTNFPGTGLFGSA